MPDGDVTDVSDGSVLTDVQITHVITDAPTTEQITQIITEVTATAPATAPQTAITVAPPDKMSFRAVDNIVKTMYTDVNTARSTALDILAVYLKGQKILYTESKTFCERRLNMLMVPAIITTAVCSIISLQLKDYQYGALIVSVLNGFNSLLLALVSYLKLDAKAEAHKVAAYKYDKLQSFCEFKSGKILFLNDKKDQVDEIIDQIETQVKEIKETNQFILPERIRYTFRETYGQNIFSTVKEIQNEELIMTNQLKGIINRLVALNLDPVGNADAIRSLEKEQNDMLDTIIHLRDRFLNIDNMFDREIGIMVERAKWDMSCLSWLNT
jgi:hypothetical protein